MAVLALNVAWWQWAVGCVVVGIAPIVAALPAIASLIGGLFGRKKTGQQNPQDLAKTTQQDFAALLNIPEIRQLLQMQLGQAQLEQQQALRLDPLKQMVTNATMQLMPRGAGQGMTLPQGAQNPPRGPRLQTPSVNWPK